MPGVIADPEELRKLAAALTKAAQQCEQVSQQLNRALQATDWRDNERAKFEQSFKDTLKTLNRVSDQLRTQYPPQLLRKAAALEQFRK